MNRLSNMHVFDAIPFVWREDHAQFLAAVGEVALALWMQGGLLLLAALAWRAATKEPATRVWIARGTLAGLALLPVLLFVPGWPRFEVRRATAPDSQSTPVETSRPDALLTAEASPLVATSADEPILRVDGDAVLSSERTPAQAMTDTPPSLAPESNAAEPVPQHIATEAEPVAVHSVDPPVLPQAPARSLRESPPTLSTSDPSVRRAPWDGTSLLGAVWLTVSAGVCVWLTVGWCIVRGRVRRSRAAGPALLDELRRVAGRGRLPRLRLAEFWRMPGAVGWWRPVIVLPASVDLEPRSGSRPLGDETKGDEARCELTTHAVRGALAHELAHIRSGDLSLLALERALLPLYFAQPALWLLRRRLRDDQELVADAVAAEGDRVGYAESLLEWVKASGAARRRRDWRMPIFQGVSMSESSGSLARRMEMLLDPNKSIQPRASRRVVWLVLLVVLGTTCGLAAIDAASSNGLSRARNWLAARLATDGVATQPADFSRSTPVDSPVLSDEMTEAAPRRDYLTWVNQPAGEAAAPVARNAAQSELFAPELELPAAPTPISMPPAGVRSVPTPVDSFDDASVQASPLSAGAPRRLLLRCVIGTINEDKVRDATETLRTLLPGMENPVATTSAAPVVGDLLEPAGHASFETASQLTETWLPRAEALLRLNLVREAGLIKVLAEPTLVAETGHTAKFHAGGELPVVEVRERINGRTTPSNVSAEPFGLRLEITPTVKKTPRRLPGSAVPLSLQLRISHSELNRADPTRPPVIERRTLETETNLTQWTPGQTAILVEQELPVVAGPLKAAALPEAAPDPRRDRTFAVITIEAAVPQTATPPTDPFAGTPLNPVATATPVPAPETLASPPSTSTDSAFDPPLPAQPTPAPPVSAVPVAPPPTPAVPPNPQRSHTVVKVEFVELFTANVDFSKENEQRSKAMIAKLEQRRLNPQSGKGTHVAVKMHVRELAELRSLLTSPVGRNTPDAGCLKPAQQFRFLADPNRRKLTANDWGVPSASGWSFAFEATATAARGRQSDGEEGVTHFDLDARMASFDIIEEETKYPDLEPMRIVRHRLKQPESARFQVRLAPREVVVFVENLPVTRTQAKTAKQEPASILVAIVSCEAHTELPDWADPNLIRPPSVVPYHPSDRGPLWSSAMEGTKVEPLSADPQALRGKGVNSDAGLTGGIVLPSGGTSPATTVPASNPSATGLSVLTELEKIAARELEVMEDEYRKFEMLARKGVDTQRDLEASSAKCAAYRERLRQLRELLETYRTSPPPAATGNVTPAAPPDAPRPLPVPPTSDPNVTTPPTVETPKASPDTAPAREASAEPTTEPQADPIEAP